MNLTISDLLHIAPSPPRRLLGFVLCSVALHGLLLSLALSVPNPEHILFGEQALQVQIEKQATSSVASNTRNILTAPSDQRLNEATSETQDDSSSSRTEVTNSTQSGAQDSQALQNYLRGVLQTELSRHLRYPQLARERGWQGTVVVGVTIAPDGELIATRLFHSSGHALLDEASLTGLSRVRSLPMQTAVRGTDPVEVILPILFRLTDNS